MVTTRSKTSKLNSESEIENNVQLTKPVNSKTKKVKSVTPGGSDSHLIIFVSLLLDLLAFTVILPLFPSILQYYKTYDTKNGLYSYFEQKINNFQRFAGVPLTQNTVLFGGFLGSLFSFLQFLSSPIIGALSDVYGRKFMIILCLIGIAASYYLWSISTTFLMFVLARIVGGISKGNLSLSMAAITDVSSSENRASGMAIIGSAFSIGFVIGPMIGAYFTKVFESQQRLWFTKWIFRPALFSFSLIVVDIVFVFFVFKETLTKEKRSKSVANSLRQAIAYISIKDLFQFNALKNISSKDIKQLRTLGVIYFLYLFLYSGLEFTLTFLTHYKFYYTSMEQGWMFFGIGLIMALIQGLYVRRVPSVLVQIHALSGLLLIVPSFFIIGLAQNIVVLLVGIFFFAVSTALVVPCLTTIASKYGSQSQKGTTLGVFRSLGALARALGPIVASIAYWTIGPSLTYCIGGILLLIPFYILMKSPTMKL